MATEPIRSKEDVSKFANYYFEQKEWRNYALIVMGLNTALRISDLLMVSWKQVYDFQRNKYKTHLELTESKTGKHQKIALNQAIIEALGYLLPHAEGEFLFAGRETDANGKHRPITRQQAHRIVKKAAAAAQMTGKISCHSMRKTFGYHAWKANAHVSVLMEIYNHSSYAMTRRYLGIDQDERDAVYEMVQLK
jgi:integrase